ncbi:hypothetical protein ACJMK2_004126 [Sinanodonta woodiana]|uniref:Extracellular sulfatase n=1 Tax=Sinanodonta woodiana TaxID=1069815 RepID=A0ABD3Y088_SINWO
MKAFHFLGRFVLVILTFVSLYTLEAAKSKSRNSRRDSFHEDQYYYSTRGKPHKRERSEKPNIIFILTDDQDELLGSMKAMPRTVRIMGRGGVQFTGAFVTTPMCCPSRSTILTGLYTHNHHVYTNNDNCSSTEWQAIHEPRTFAKYLSDAGYRTGFFGKYLNEYNGTYTPPGWREWVGLIKNSRFYNYTINRNDKKIKHADNYYRDYFTDLIANDSVTFLSVSKAHFKTKPVMMMLSVPAPHGPEDAAPQYQHLFYNDTNHRTPSWDYTNNSDKQWLLQTMKPMEPIEKKFTDILNQKRLQTLQSVDDLVEKVYENLKALGELDNTYIIYTSDHGYHLGQFGVVKGKALPYDFDVRVPLFIRGPGVPEGMKISNIATNADLAPTILDMAGIEIPEHMDGKSLLRVITAARNPHSVSDKGFVKTKKPWRDTILIERGKVTTKVVKKLLREHKKTFMENLASEDEFPNDLLPFANDRLRRLLKICSRPESSLPCGNGQRWICIKENGKRRLQKCRNSSDDENVDENDDDDADISTNNDVVEHETDVDEFQQDAPESNAMLPTPKCQCKTQEFDLLTPDEKLSVSFLKAHVKQKDFVPKFIRGKRSVMESLSANTVNIANEYANHLIEKQLDLTKQKCRFLPNGTFTCDNDLSHDVQTWKDHKARLDEIIEETRNYLAKLKMIRKHMKKQKPAETYTSLVDDNETGPRYIPDIYDREMNETFCNCEEDGAEPVDEVLEEETGAEEDYIVESVEEDYVELKKERKKDRQKGKKHGSGHSKLNRKSKNRNPEECRITGVECTIMDNDHWKTPPTWTYGPICICTNSNNNTYWCMRTINETHDYLFCEFISNFISYYDLKKDPYQLRNAVHDLSYTTIQQLHDQLSKLRACQGAKECTFRNGIRASKWHWYQQGVNNIEDKERHRRRIGEHRHRHKRL